MSVQITALDLSGLDDLGVALWKRIVSDIATGGAAELYWNKPTRNALAKGVKAVGKVSKKAFEKVLCPVAKGFKDGKAGEAATKSVYGTVAVVAASAVSSVCPKDKKAAVVVVEKKYWYDNPWAVGGAAVGCGLLLGALFSRGR